MPLRPHICLTNREEQPDQPWYVKDWDDAILADNFETWDAAYNWILDNRAENRAFSLWRRGFIDEELDVWFVGDFQTIAEVEATVRAEDRLEEGFFELVNSADRVVGVIWKGVLYLEK